MRAGAGHDLINFSAGITDVVLTIDVADDEDVNVEGDLDILDAAGLTITGPPSEVTITQDVGDERVLEQLAGDLELEKLVITGGRATKDAGDDGNGGGWPHGASPARSSFVKSTSSTTKRTAITTGIFSFHGGGGVWSLADVDVIDSTFKDNHATGAIGIGGAMLLYEGTLDITGSLIGAGTDAQNSAAQGEASPSSARRRGSTTPSSTGTSRA